MQFESFDTSVVAPAVARWELHPQAGRVHYEAHWTRRLGFGEEASADDTRFWRSRVHPDDLPPMLGALSAFIEGWRSHYESRFRLLDGHGRYRLLMSRGDVAERDTAGRVVRVCGQLRDLSDDVSPGQEPGTRSRLSPALPESQFQRMLQAAPVGLLRMEHGLVRWVNAAFATQVGRPLQEIIDRPAAGFFTGVRLPDAEHGDAPVDAQVLRSDGQRRWVQLRVSRLPAHPFAVLLACTDVATLHARCEAAEHQALHDPLTGLANRRLLQWRLDQALAHAQRYDQPIAIACLDLDHFKQVNDTLGHAAGDHLLSVVGRRMQAAVRAHDLVARLGGDEFVVLLTGPQSDQDAAKVRFTQEAEAVLRRLMAQTRCDVDLGDGRSARVTVSAGLVMADVQDMCASDLLARADRLLLDAKQGRDRLLVLRSSAA